MKITFNFNNEFKKICFLLIFLVFLIFQINFKNPEAIAMNKNQNLIVVEELRLKVPAEAKEVWLKTEKKIWESWLTSQDGFLGRQLFWDKEREEALILVSWKSKKLWKSISIAEVNAVQKQFEDDVKSILNVSENPFKLIYEGELKKQG